MAEFTDQTTYSVSCPVCGSDAVIKNGLQNGQQRFRCNACRKQFRSNGKAPGARVDAEQIGAAIRMFYSGMSYKQIAESIHRVFDIPEPSKQTIYAWVKRYTDEAVRLMKQFPARVGTAWVADEMQVDVGGEKMWNWNVMDERTRYILASHLTKERNTDAAIAVMEKAQAASAIEPRVIKTDKLGSYTGAISTVFPHTKHVQSEGIRAAVNNNLSERLQGTFRQRIKTLRGLESRETGQRYLDGWVITYNLFREHEGLNYATPGKKAGVTPPFTEWADVARGRSTPPAKTPARWQAPPRSGRYKAAPAPRAKAPLAR